MKLCIALDLDKKIDNIALAKDIKNNFDINNIILKVGLRSFIRDGKDFIKELKNMGFSIFLDLKLYDIPNTMNDALIECSKLDIDILTIHASAGSCTMKLLAKTLNSLNLKTKIIAVSALTSFSEEDFKNIYNINLIDGVKNFAKMVSESKLHGLVCSSLEIETIKNISKDLLTIVPGIRPFKEDHQDQKRVGTIASAKKLGADFLVIGRPIYQASDRLEALASILKQMQD